MDALAIYAEFFGSHIHVAPEYLVVTLLIAFAIYALRRPGTGFLRWLFPRAVYRHPSNLTDLKLFVLGRLLALLGLFNKITLTSLIAATLAQWLRQDGAPNAINPWLVAAVLFLITDFVIYWVHRIYHTTALLWPIHSVHHSADVLTPLTAYRQHPLSDVISTLFTTLFLGLAQGLALGLSGVEFTGAQIAGVNGFFFGFALLVANFRHSHIWISFGPFWEHLIISPAQHQIHHSVATRHLDRNYGENFAIWDWMFGTLYLPAQPEELRFGISDGKGQAAPQRHTGLISALWVPLVDMARVLRPARRRGHKTTSDQSQN